MSKRTIVKRLYNAVGRSLDWAGRGGSMKMLWQTTLALGASVMGWVLISPGWALLVGIAVFMVAALLGPAVMEEIKERRITRARDALRADYVTACAIVNFYIDPYETMRDRIRMSVRKDILDCFGNTKDARIGTDYNRVSLEKWLRANAARLLVKYRGELK